MFQSQGEKDMGAKIMPCSWAIRLRSVLQQTWTHATGLTKYVIVYKTLVVLLKKMNGGRNQRFDTFFSGLIAGYFTLGERTTINEHVGCAIAFQASTRRLTDGTRFCCMVLDV